MVIAVGLSLISTYGQGYFNFNNRAVPAVDARFVLSTDSPGTSSVGTDFQVQLFAGPIGTPLDQLQPTDPGSVGFRGPAGSIVAGYVMPWSVKVAVIPPAGQNPNTEVLVRAFDGPTWETASYRYQGVYTVEVFGVAAPILQMGTSPLVLETVPEPSILTLIYAGLGTLTLALGRPATRGWVMKI